MVINMKKILLVLLIAFMLFGCTTNEVTDAKRFKEEYESLNGTTREKDGQTIRSIEIDKDNPMVYITAEDLVQKMKDNESFVVYFGFNDCPWCRSVIPYMIDVAKSKNIETVYYVDVKDIRDQYELDGQEPVKTKEGSKGYNEILELMDNVLDEYMLYGENFEVDGFSKRIYAPNFVVVKKGEAVFMNECTSTLEEDPYMELSEEIILDMKSQLEELFDVFLEKGSQGCNIQKKC